MDINRNNAVSTTTTTTTTADNSTFDDDEDGVNVELYIYDLSRGMARSLSSTFLGVHLDGIYHTGIVIEGQEYFFGAEGIVSCSAGGTILGPPTQVLSLSRTHLPKEIYLQHLDDLRNTIFKGSDYDIFTNNCNNFSNEFGKFLCGCGIPEHILNLPNTVASTPIGQILKSFYQTSILPRQRGGADTITATASSDNPPIEEPNLLELSIRERVLNIMSSEEGSPPPAPQPKRRDVVAEIEEEERKERDEKKKNREQPIIFRDLGSPIESLLDELEKSLAKVELNDDEMRSLKELREYSLGDEGSWVLSDEFLNLVGRILLSKEPGIGEESRVYLLKVLAWLAVTKDDVILVLHQDRKDHVLMRYSSLVEEISPKSQEAAALLLCNLFENVSTSEWLLYISEWDNDSRGQTSNIRVTTKVGVHALLSKDINMKEIGSALVFNMLSKEVKVAVFDDVAVEMALALLQFLSEKPPETLVWRGLRSLLRCCTLARAEVPSLIKMVGPSPSELMGISGRCDDLVNQINALLAAV